jgi:outer membrane protein assembly factor BamD
MHRRFTLPVVGLLLVLLLAACSNKRVNNPLANVDSAQPDKVLFDRAMDAMKHNHFDVARITLQTLINTYPDSEFLARAKLAVGDSWYAAGGSAAMAQAEAEYKDFITFFPNMPEASEAQMKIADIHYREMGKPDRDFTHAIRAEQEYRNLILQYPDSPLVPQAKEHLLQVQEVLAEREFRIGRFYYMREAWAAAEARLKSVIDTYPLYSGADEALYILGQCYEGQVENVRAAAIRDEAAKGKLIKAYSDAAAAAYARILTRYPAMARAADAKARLEAMHYQAPEPTKEALAQNEREEASRGEMGMVGKLWSNFSSRPDTATAASVGEPTLVDPQQTSAPDLVKQANALVRAVQTGATGSNSLSVETIKAGEPPPNQPIPRSQPAAEGNQSSGIPELEPISDAGSAASGDTAPAPAQAAPVSSPGPEQTGIPELIPDSAKQAGSTQANDAPGAQSEAPPLAPPQVNQAATPPGGQKAESDSKPDSTESSSSRPKKKKGFLGVF